MHPNALRIQIDPRRSWDSPSGFGIHALHPRIRDWIRKQGWKGLRAIQLKAIPELLAGDRDVILSAPTASGKTEAALLPILTRILAAHRPSVRALFVFPLKSLVDDQHARISGLCQELNVPIHRWHGDVEGSEKSALMRNPSGLLLTTPESLEAILLRLGKRAEPFFRYLDFVVIDEVHSFLESERGMQLASLLHRVDASIGREVTRVGLSATLADPTYAAQYIRAGAPEKVVCVGGQEEMPRIEKILRVYQEPRNCPDDDPRNAMHAIAHDLYQDLNGTTSLVFANSRRDVEDLADRLTKIAEEQGHPNQFFAHHANLSASVRKEHEQLLRNPEIPATCIATSTLELGIDVGEVSVVAQIGAPSKVASLRQRVGRSGRRGVAGQLYLLETFTEEHVHQTAIDALRPGLIQQMAILELMEDGWCEPPNLGHPHFSTLVQQIFAILLSARSPVDQDWLFELVCQSGPFRQVRKTTFEQLLGNLVFQKIIISTQRQISLSPEGELAVKRKGIYTAFVTVQEFDLVAEGRVIGRMPSDAKLVVGESLNMAGKRWEIERIDELGKAVYLKPSQIRNPKSLSSESGEVHSQVRQKMREIYLGKEIPDYMDSGAIDVLRQARTKFRVLGIEKCSVVEGHGTCWLLHWSSDTVANTVCRLLGTANLHAWHQDFAIHCCHPWSEVKMALRNLKSMTAMELAGTFESSSRGKFDEFVPGLLLDEERASRFLDLDGAREAISSFLAH